MALIMLSWPGRGGVLHRERSPSAPAPFAPSLPPAGPLTWLPETLWLPAGRRQGLHRGEAVRGRGRGAGLAQSWRRAQCGLCWNVSAWISLAISFSCHHCPCPRCVPLDVSCQGQSAARSRPASTASAWRSRAVVCSGRTPLLCTRCRSERAGDGGQGASS